MDLGPIKDLAAGLYAQYFDAITVNQYTSSTIAATGQVQKELVATFDTGAKRKKFSGGYDIQLIQGTLANKQYRKYEMVATSESFVPQAMDEVVTTDGTWDVVGCTPVDDGGVQVTYDLILVKL
jgi:hypothetical protein